MQQVLLTLSSQTKSQEPASKGDAKLTQNTSTLSELIWQDPRLVCPHQAQSSLTQELKALYGHTAQTPRWSTSGRLSLDPSCTNSSILEGTLGQRRG